MNKKNVKITWKDSENKTISLKTSLFELLNKSEDDLIESLEPECNSSSCNNEGQNFCDCGGIYENYILNSIEILIDSRGGYI